MLCVFQNSNDVSRCIELIDSESYQLLRAETNSPFNGEGFYAVVFPPQNTKKITVSVDARSREDLDILFSNKVHYEIIEKVWNSNNSWASCFDMLNSLVSSHGSVLLEKCEFMLDNAFWPGLHGESVLKTFSTEHLDSPVEHENWNIFSVKDIEEMEFIEKKFKKSTNLSVTKSLDNNNYKTEEDWEILSVNDIVMTERDTIKVTTNKPIILSYKEALLQKNYNNNTTNNVQPSLNHFKNDIKNMQLKFNRIIKSKKSATTVIENTTNNHINSDADDDDFANEFYQSSVFLKGFLFK
jgi:hypothetical protein